MFYDKYYSGVFWAHLHYIWLSSEGLTYLPEVFYFLIIYKIWSVCVLY